MAGALVLAGTYCLAAVTPVPAVAVSRAAGNSSPAVTPPLASPVDILIAVDESGSITPAEMTLEQTAARLIALGEFAPESKVGVLGFGGPDDLYNATSKPQPPVDQACPMTEVGTPAGRQSLSVCIGKLHIRTLEQGNQTDFIDAIRAGVDDLTGAGDKGRPLLLFLLTDGRLDMVGSPDFPGTNYQAVNARANRYLFTRVIPRAKRARVRIWPLGFGRGANLRELRRIAAGGALGSCNEALPDATPHAIRVLGAADIESALLQIFASARCFRYLPGPKAKVRSGASVNLYVTVPDIVTFGSIEVVRRYRQIPVTYYDPAGRRVPVPTGTLAGQTFLLGGAAGPVESLTIDYPIPGRWRVHLVAGPGIPARALVTTSVLWRGVLHFDIMTHPAHPSPGHAVTVTVRLQVGARPLNARDLSGVHLSVRVTGPGLAAPIVVPENDDGIPPDQTAYDGIYNGRFTVPGSASGRLRAVGVVSASGVVGDEESVPITIRKAIAPQKTDPLWWLWLILIALDAAAVTLALRRILDPPRRPQGASSMAPPSAPNPWPSNIPPGGPALWPRSPARHLGQLPAPTMPDPGQIP